MLAFKLPKKNSGVFNESAQKLAIIFIRKILSLGSSPHSMLKIYSSALFVVLSSSPQHGRNPSSLGAHRLRHSQGPPQTPPPPHRSREAACRSRACSSIRMVTEPAQLGECNTRTSRQLQQLSILPEDLALHLFFTNFFLEALGFNRLLPAPKVLSRTCRMADRLEMSFSAKGDSPAT